MTQNIDPGIFFLSKTLQATCCPWLLLTSCLLAASFSNFTALAADRVVVPIHAHRLSNGNVRFTVPVNVGGGRTIGAMLDTGSFGLRVTSRTLAPSQYQPVGIVRGAIQRDIPPRNHAQLKRTILTHSRRIQKSADRVRKYFEHELIRYTA